MQKVEIAEVSAVDDVVAEAFARLIPQLNDRIPVPGRETLQRIIDAGCTVVFVARLPESGRIVGTLSLALFQVPTGMRARIEDVIVDGAARGAGAGAALVQAAVQRAVAAGVTNVELTSHESREAANRLYLRLGFERRATNVYRLACSPPA